MAPALTSVVVPSPPHHPWLQPTIGHNFLQRGNPIVTVIATNARGSITSEVEYSVFDPIASLAIIASDSDVAPCEIVA